MGKNRINPEERKALKEKRVFKRFEKEVMNQKRGKDEERLKKYYERTPY